LLPILRQWRSPTRQARLRHVPESLRFRPLSAGMHQQILWNWQSDAAEKSQEALASFLQTGSESGSPHYRHFSRGNTIRGQFGPTEQRLQAVEFFRLKWSFTITMHLQPGVMDVNASSATRTRVYVEMREYRHPTGARISRTRC